MVTVFETTPHTLAHAVVSRPPDSDTTIKQSPPGVRTAKLFGQQVHGKHMLAHERVMFANLRTLCPRHKQNSGPLSFHLDTRPTETQNNPPGPRISRCWSTIETTQRRHNTCSRRLKSVTPHRLKSHSHRLTSNSLPTTAFASSLV